MSTLFIAPFQFIIMVIDSTDRERLAVTREELYTLLQHEDLSKACLLVYANKQVCTLLLTFPICSNYIQ